MGFSRFGLSDSLLHAITQLGYAEPTPIQQQAIPEALRGRDLRACAQTGTGKTCAFVVPIIERLTRHPAQHRPSALVLTPTRELATQVVTVANSLLRGSHLRTVLILGGANINTQTRQLRQGADIIVATPGRLKDLINRNAVSLQHIQTLVMDEADRMLDMGFLPDVRRILSYIPQKRQTLLFSATFGPGVKQLTSQFLKDPVMVDLSPSSTATSSHVTQMVYPVPSGQKRALLQALLELGNMTSVLIFMRTKHDANHLLKAIQEWGKKVAVIHSNRSPGQRQQALQGFKDGRYQILVATDIAARGIDVKNISHVINYDVPRYAEDYVHRIGRTGRAEAVGEAFTLVSPNEEPYLKKIENFIKKPIPRAIIPDFPYERRPQIFKNNSQSKHRPPQHKHNKPHHHKQGGHREAHPDQQQPKNFSGQPLQPFQPRHSAIPSHSPGHQGLSQPHQTAPKGHSTGRPSHPRNRWRRRHR